MNPEDLQLLVTRTMPFGKYKGRIIADLPGNDAPFVLAKRHGASDQQVRLWVHAQPPHVHGKTLVFKVSITRSQWSPCTSMTPS